MPKISDGQSSHEFDFDLETVSKYLAAYSSRGNWLLVFSVSIALAVVISTRDVLDSTQDVRTFEAVESIIGVGPEGSSLFLQSYCKGQFNEGAPVFSRRMLANHLPAFQPGDVAHSIYDDIDPKGAKKLYAATTQELSKWMKTTRLDFFYEYGSMSQSPLNWSDDATLAQLLAEYENARTFKTIDAWALEYPLMGIFKIDEVPSGPTFQKYGIHQEIFAGAETPYAIDPNRKQEDLIDLSLRVPFDFDSNTLSVVGLLGQGPYNLIDSSFKEHRDHLTVKLRFSDHRPIIGKANAIEDNPYMMDRWPVTSPTERATEDAFINEYGDLYFELRWPFVETSCPAPSQVIAHLVGESTANRMRDLIAAQHRNGGDMGMSFARFGADLRAKVATAKEGGIKLLNSNVRIVDALLLAIVVVALAGLKLNRLIVRAYRYGAPSLIQEAAHKLPIQDFHPGLVGLVTRFGKSLTPTLGLILSFTFMKIYGESSELDWFVIAFGSLGLISLIESWRRARRLERQLKRSNGPGSTDREPK